MAHEYKLTLTLKDTGESVSVSGQFDDEDWDLLEEFTLYADELLKTKFVQRGMQASLNMKWDRASGMEVSTELPPWDDVTVFLHKFRPLGLQSERTYFYKVCNILAKEIVHPYFRSMVKEIREVFSGKRQTHFQIVSNEVVLNSEKVLYDWLNAYEYHRNKEKRELVDSLHTMIPLDASKVLFTGLLEHKTMAIHNLSVLARVVLGKQKQVEFAP